MKELLDVVKAASPDGWRGMMKGVDCLLREKLAKLCAFHGATPGSAGVDTDARESCDNPDLPVKVEQALQKYMRDHASKECDRIQKKCDLRETRPPSRPIKPTRE